MKSTLRSVHSAAATAIWPNGSAMATRFRAGQRAQMILHRKIGTTTNNETELFPLAKPRQLRHSAALICSPGSAFCLSDAASECPGSSGVEQRIENPRVGGSIPPPGTIRERASGAI